MLFSVIKTSFLRHRFGVQSIRGIVMRKTALAQSRTFKDAIVTMTFGVALLSLVVQAEILQAYLKRVALHESHDVSLETSSVI